LHHCQVAPLPLETLPTHGVCSETTSIQKLVHAAVLQGSSAAPAAAGDGQLTAAGSTAWPQLQSLLLEAPVPCVWHSGPQSVFATLFERIRQLAESEGREYAAAVLSAAPDVLQGCSTAQPKLRVDVASLPDSLLPRRMCDASAAAPTADGAASLAVILTGWLAADCDRSSKRKWLAAPLSERPIGNNEVCAHVPAGTEATMATAAGGAKDAVPGASTEDAAGSEQAVHASPLELSPGGLLVEVPIHQPCCRPAPLCQQLLSEALAAAQALLQRPALPLPITCSGHSCDPLAYLDELVAADLCLDDSDSNQLLPVPISMGTDSAFAAGSGGTGEAQDLVAQLLRTGCCKRQHTAHLELFFDWGALQPPAHQFPAVAAAGRGVQPVPGHSSRHGKRAWGAACAEQAAAGAGATAAPTKRLKLALEGQAAAASTDGWQPPLRAVCAGSAQRQAGMDWLLATSRCAGLGQLREALAPLPVPPCDSSSSIASVQAVAACCVRQAMAAFPLPAARSTRHTQPEAVPPEVAASAAAWHAKHAEGAASAAAPAAASVQPTPAAAAGDKQQQMPPAAAGAAAPGSEVPASDLDFFIQLRSMAQDNASRKRASGAAVQPLKGAAEAAGAAALSGAAKRARTSAAAQSDWAAAASAAVGAADSTPAPAVADLALTGAASRQGVAPAAAAAAAAAVPDVVRVTLPDGITQLLRALDSSRAITLAALACPGSELQEAQLWDGAPAQQQLVQLQAMAKATGSRDGGGGKAVLSAEHKLRAKHLATLLLLSQTAACLLHYGIRVAHMLLQHSLQQLPAVGPALADAAAAVAAAHSALTQDHPKLQQLQRVLQSLQVRVVVVDRWCPRSCIMQDAFHLTSCCRTCLCTMCGRGARCWWCARPRHSSACTKACLQPASSLCSLTGTSASACQHHQRQRVLHLHRTLSQAVLRLALRLTPPGRRLWGLRYAPPAACWRRTSSCCTRACRWVPLMPWWSTCPGSTLRWAHRRPSRDTAQRWRHSCQQCRLSAPALGPAGTLCWTQSNRA
jgi:hypothetical protein